MHGTKTINGIHVKVHCIGSVDSLDYCDGDASPYFVGYDGITEKSGNGRVIFSFLKPITDLVLNFAGASDINGHYEEVIIYVNGKHHRLTSVGRQNGCKEDLAKINSRGNLVGCKDCSVSGWSGTKIKGPISSLMIVDTIIKGDPNGTVFSLFIGGIFVEPIIPIENTLINYTCNIAEGTAGKELIIQSLQLENAEISLKDHLGNHIAMHYQLIESTKVVIDISDLIKGEYLLEIKLEAVVESQRILIE